MNFVDKAFARRLESAEEMPQVHYARIYQKQRPEAFQQLHQIGLFGGQKEKDAEADQRHTQQKCRHTFEHRSLSQRH